MRSLTSSPQPFHTDTVCDVLCLLTKTCAAAGGRSIMSSGFTVYNELAATRPDIIHTLSRPNWPFDTCVFPLSPRFDPFPLFIRAQEEEESLDHETDEQPDTDKPPTQ